MYISEVLFSQKFPPQRKKNAMWYFPEVVFGSPGLSSPDFHRASHSFKAFRLLLASWAVFAVNFGEVQLFLLRHSLL